MNSRVLAFWTDEDGAVTVDWVVLTAATIGLGMLVVVQVSGGLGTVSGDLSTKLSGATMKELNLGQ